MKTHRWGSGDLGRTSVPGQLGWRKQEATARKEKNKAQEIDLQAASITLKTMNFRGSFGTLSLPISVDQGSTMMEELLRENYSSVANVCRI